jgi:hypothetical protein
MWLNATSLGVKTIPAGALGPAVDGPLWIGGFDPFDPQYAYGFEKFRGSIDEVAVYDRVLEDAEILEHFQAGGGEVVLGDMDCDGDVDFDDIDPFVLGLNNPELYETTFGVPPAAKGDMDGDGDFDFDDIPGFVDALRGGGPQSIPEPSTLLLVVLGMIGLVAYGYRRR